MKTLLFAAAAALTVFAGPSFGQSVSNPAGSSPSGGIASEAPAAGPAISTPRGPIVTTGQFGGVRTTTLPNGAGQGLLMNNGNGTSTLTGPTGTTTTAPTPR